MIFFDFKFIVIILLTFIVYLLYREIVNLKLKVKLLYKNTLKNYVVNDNSNEDLNDNSLILETPEENNSEKNNKNFFSKCIVKTIKIPLNLNSFLNNPFENSYQSELNNTQIIELSSSNIEEVTPTKSSSEVNKNTLFSEVNKNTLFSEMNENILFSEVNKNTLFSEVNLPEINENLPEINENLSKVKNNLETIEEEKTNIINETTENNTDNKSYVSSSHIEIYSNDSNDVNISNQINEPIKPIEPKVDYKNILKNLNKYKLPELQDLAIQFKLPKENENKKKTRIELIEEIKIYILNKNI
jgi:hypothetical protein